MAGLGKKTFSDGEVLSAADVNGYLMDQSVMRFADSAARSSAIGTPSEGMVTYLDDVNQIEVYDGTAWVDQQAPILSEGTAGQYLQSNGTAGSQWVNLEIADDIITTEGDLIIGDVSGDAARLGIGAADTVLTSNGTTATWVAGGAGGIQTLISVPFETIAIYDVDFPANSIVRFAVITTSVNPFSVVLLDSSDNVVDTITLDRDNPFTYNTEATAISKVAIENDVIDEAVQIVFSNPADARQPDQTPDIIVIESTQSVTLTKSYTALCLGGGAGGGGITSFAGAAAGGGGSGFLSTGTLTAGTYTATIGAGGAGGAAGLTGSTGGTTTIGAISASGGSGGQPPSAEAVGGNGGNGGSGGGGGSTSLTGDENSGSTGGANGADGGDGVQVSGTAGTGGSGSGSTLPTQYPSSTIIQAGNGGANITVAAGVYGGGGGGSIGGSSTVGINADGFAGGGGGARGDFNGGTSDRAGGNGFQGYILLVEA